MVFPLIHKLLFTTQLDETYSVSNIKYSCYNKKEP